MEMDFSLAAMVGRCPPIRWPFSSEPRLPVPEAGSPGSATSLVLGFRSLRLRSVELSGN